MDFDLGEEFDNEMEFEEVIPIASAPSGTPLEVLPGFDVEAGSTWIYPSNMSYRKYQFDIVQASLYHNTLVCLPTGLGKTFIAAVIMYNYYRWYPKGKIVFMAPTKPLVGQQIEACFKVMGIPQSDTVEMTGEVGQRERESAWKHKVLNSDLTRGRCSAGQIKLLIVDEAHRALGNYAYCTAVRELVRAGTQARIVALSATPGSDIPSVKQMIQNLCISHIELRQEDSPDIVPYTHKRTIEKIVIKIGEDVEFVKSKLMAIIEIYTKKLSAAKAVSKGHLPSSYNKFSLLQAREAWRQAPPVGATKSLQGQVEGDFATVINLFCGYDLVLRQGLRSLYRFWTKTDNIEPYVKRIRAELHRIPMFREVMAFLTESYKGDTSNSLLNAGPGLSQAGASAMVDPTVDVSTSHPKMDKLLEVVKDHFKNFVTTDDRDTKVIIFNEKRDCVSELVACLSKLKPLVRPKHFIGQASSASNKGLNQKEQIEIVKRFKEGVYNTIVATCVGEEGLDIGEVDLIVLYDMKTSPISYVQRIGRTGRKRDGRVVVLVTEGIEERDYRTCLYSVKKINKELQDKARLEHVLYQAAPRMIPQGLNPVCHQMRMKETQWETKPGSSEPRSLMLSSRLSRGTRDDVFRNNRGALTEAEQERWQNTPRFGGKVKTLKQPRELWAAENRDPFHLSLEEAEEEQQTCYNLAEYSLWQTGKQNRRIVSVGALTSTYNNILNIIRNPEISKRKKRPSGDSSRITNYFTSQGKSQDNITAAIVLMKNRPLGNITEVSDDEDFEDEIPLVKLPEDVVEDQNHAVDDVVLDHIEDVPEEEEMHVEEEKLSDEELLLRELLSDDDSGIQCCDPSVCSSPPSIQRLLDRPPTKRELETFDVTAAIERAVKKYERQTDSVLIDLIEDKTELFVPQPQPQSVLLYPVERNESMEDMFAESFSYIDTSVDKVEPAPTEVSKHEEKEEMAASNFNLGSPVNELEDNFLVDDVVSPAKPVVDREEGDPPPQIESNFDLGCSPIMEDNDNVESNFDLGSPFCSDIDEPDEVKVPDLKPHMSTSTPIMPWSKKSVRTEQPKVVEKTEMNESEDMFGEDSADDDLFQAVELDYDIDKKEGKNTSQYETSALMEMINLERSETSETSAKKRRKLTDIFDSISEDDKVPLTDSVSVKNDSVTSNRSKSGEKSTSTEQSKSDGSSDRSANLLSGHQESLTERKVCPVCNVPVPGDLAKFNEHLDICLNAGVIEEITQHDEKSRSRQSVQSPESSPIGRKTGRARARVLASQSVHQEEESPAKSRSSESEESLLSTRKAKKCRGGGRQFIDSEADLSGEEASEDEADETGQNYDESFVDDASQAVDHAVYLQSVRSPEFRKPREFSRPLPPITDDIFSQAVRDSDYDDYEEDSFCVGDSMVEVDSCHDTLDLLEAEAEDVDRGGRRRTEIAIKPKRKRILLNSSSEESVDNNVSSVASNSHRDKKRKRIIMIPSDDDTLPQESPIRQEPGESSSVSHEDLPAQVFKSPIIPRSSQVRVAANRSDPPSVSSSTEEKLTVICSSSEIVRSQELVSSLRYLHGLNVLVEKCDSVSLVTGRDTAVLRVPESEFNLGTAREKLIERVHEANDRYSEILIVVEVEKKKAGGDRQRGGQRTKQQDLTVSQLGLAGIKVSYSSSQLDTADLVARLARLSEERGRQLARVEDSPARLQVVRWLQDIPGVGLGAARSLAVTAPSLSALIGSSKERLEEAGVDQRTAERLLAFFRQRFDPGLTELAPL